MSRLRERTVLPRNAQRDRANMKRQSFWGGATSSAIQTLIYPMLEKRRNPDAARILRNFHNYEFASEEEVSRLQWQQLGAILLHAANTVPYYGKRFAELGIGANDIRTQADFARLPVLTKSIIRENRESLISETCSRAALMPNATGGSTGEPLQFYQDRRYWAWAYASQTFVESWWGIRPGDRTASLWGVDRDLPLPGWKQRLHSAINQTRVCNVFGLEPEQLKQFALMLQSWAPRYLTGYASALEVFAKFLSGKPEIVIRPQAIKSTAEVLDTRQRELIERVFDCPVYNFYGSREVNNIAAECAEHDGLHVNSIARYVEIVDQFGSPVPAGIPGRVLVTDLTNYAMPFIRYENGDVASWSEGTCSCGRPFPRFASVLGRKSDFIVTPNGKLIHGEFFTHLFYGASGVLQFQAIQSAPDLLRIDVVLKSGAEPSVLDRIASTVRETVGSEMKCDVRVVDQIPREASGKHRFTISHVEVPWGTVTVPGQGKEDAVRAGD